ncbi:E3 ubiquitin ligase RNF157-like [Mesoplodon densirostris]|uniref:E3 ubiquitin ligase RNF157-like n=1 Tax=Mesoplodon densirostris TaxID=48708 RepID=UPI0028DCEA60|nr:E3 ubiquitin ligase RNF157-like [Mesoplodon densirostris]
MATPPQSIMDLRCPEAGFCFPPPGRRGSPSGPRSPAALQANRRSECSIRPGGERRTAGRTLTQGWLGAAQVAWLRRGALEVGAPRCQPGNQASDPAVHARRLGLCSCPRARCRGAERSSDTRRPLLVAQLSRASARALARWSPCLGARWGGEAALLATLCRCPLEMSRPARLEKAPKSPLYAECGITPESENLTLSSSGAVNQSSCTGMPLSSTISSPEDPASSSLAQSVMSMVSSQISTDTVSSMSSSYIAPGMEGDGEALPCPRAASRTPSEEAEVTPAASPDCNFAGLSTTAEEQDAEGNDVLEEEDGSPTQEDGQRTFAFLGMECDNNNGFDIASVKALHNKLCSEVSLPGAWQADDNVVSRRNTQRRRLSSGSLEDPENRLCVWGPLVI